MPDKIYKARTMGMKAGGKKSPKMKSKGNKKMMKIMPAKKKATFNKVAFARAKNKVFGLSNQEDMGNR